MDQIAQPTAKASTRSSVTGGSTYGGSTHWKLVISYLYNMVRPGWRRTSTGRAPFRPGWTPAGRDAPSPGLGPPWMRGDRGRRGSSPWMELRQELPPVLPGDLKQIRQSPEEFIGELAGTEHLPHRPRWPRGSGGAHVVNVGWAAAVHWPSASLYPTWPVSAWRPVFLDETRKADESSKKLTGT